MKSATDVFSQKTAQQESDLFITSMITDRIGRHEVLLPINHKNYNFREKKKSQVIKGREICIVKCPSEIDYNQNVQ